MFWIEVEVQNCISAELFSLWFFLSNLFPPGAYLSEMIFTVETYSREAYWEGLLTLYILKSTACDKK